MSFGKVINYTSRTETCSIAADSARGGSLSSDLLLVHKVFRREFGLLPVLVADVAVGDRARAALVTAHCRELTTALRHHNTAESELLWPRLRDRSQLDPAAGGRLRSGHQHNTTLLDELAGLLPLWEQGADADLRAVLTDILAELADAVVEHLDATKELVLPMVDGQFTATEWLALGLRAASWIPLHRMAWMLGAMLEDATPVERANLMAKVPGPARLLYRMVGEERYTREMVSLRAGRR